MLANTALTSTLLQHVPWAIFVFCFGACVGSFMNVVMYRLPLGMSLSMPPSRCPICGGRLRFFRENLPIIGWLMLRGSCRHCREPIPIRYMLVELGMALAFLGLYIVLFWVNWRTPWWGDIGGEWWWVQQFARGWPAYVAIAFCFAGLVCMTIIDARTFTIPIQIPVFVTIAAFILWPVQALFAAPWPRVQTWPIPGVDWWWFSVAACGMIGVVTARLLLQKGVVRWSFADYEEYVQDDEPLAEYPHARREMVVELVYLLPVIIGLVVGGCIGLALPVDGPPVILQAMGASFIGYLSGAGLVWAIRILGTFAFGREAMGLGDVHLLGAVGAVFGWFDPILIFFIAPFIGLSWILISSLVSAVARRGRREMPYGPHLALATAFLFLCRPMIMDVWSVLIPTVSMPQQALSGG
jgi:leader peptidase (prepilin peptidase)/N-methyltransferase